MSDFSEGVTSSFLLDLLTGCAFRMNQAPVRHFVFIHLFSTMWPSGARPPPAASRKALRPDSGRGELGGLG